jgi:hypothetical protein
MQSNLEIMMSENVIQTDLGFLTVDGRIVHIQYNEWHKLSVKIKAYDKTIFDVVFHNVIAYSFDYISHDIKYRTDETHIVENSEWLNRQKQRFLNNYPGDDVSELVHYKLCFNMDDEELNIICNRNIDVSY